MKIAAVQIDSYAGEIEKNVAKHLEFAEQAVQSGANLIVFPELSITGYEPTLAAELATPPTAPIFAPLQEFVNKNDTILAIGLPLKTEGKPQIGLGIFRPFTTPLAYAKMLLDPDELPYFSAGEQSLVIQHLQHRIAFGICYETQQEAHLQQLMVEQPSVYIASVALPKRSIEKSHEHYAAMAKKYAIPIILADCVGQHDVYHCGGCSASWIAEGEKMGELNGTDEGVILVDIAERWAMIW